MSELFFFCGGASANFNVGFLGKTKLTAFDG